MILIAIEFVLLLYTQGPENHTDIWNFITKFDQWNWSSIIVSLGALGASVALAGISSGGTFRFVTDFLTLGSAIVGLASVGVVFTQLMGFFRQELMNRFFTTCTTVASCAPATYLTAIIIGPFALYYVWTVFDWWRNKDN